MQVSNWLTTAVVSCVFAMQASAGVVGFNESFTANSASWRNPVVVTPCPADVDANHIVNGGDLAMVLQAWGPCSNCAADLDNDNIVSASDLAMLLQSWGACP